MLVWHGCFFDERENLLEKLEQPLLLVIVETQMQVLKVSYTQKLIHDAFSIKLTMWFGEVVLAGVTDVDDVCNTKGLNDVCITSMVIIAQEEAAWENLIWIAFSDSPAHKTKNVRKNFVTYGLGIKCLPT